MNWIHFKKTQSDEELAGKAVVVSGRRDVRRAEQRNLSSLRAVKFVRTWPRCSEGMPKAVHVQDVVLPHNMVLCYEWMRHVTHLTLTDCKMPFCLRWPDAAKIVDLRRITGQDEMHIETAPDTLLSIADSDMEGVDLFIKGPSTTQELVALADNVLSVVEPSRRQGLINPDSRVILDHVNLSTFWVCAAFVALDHCEVPMPLNLESVWTPELRITASAGSLDVQRDLVPGNWPAPPLQKLTVIVKQGAPINIPDEFSPIITYL